ncbi:MAG TPA: thiamine-phosphate kinase [Nevskiaceae bacterium]|nr:thiamine-phosphate kinase [Nevskiaceae bacterium]
MDEFALIDEFFRDATPPGDDVVLGIGDDAALLTVPPSWELAVCTDTLVAGRHFPTDTAPADIGWKALAVNLSDLAAMGAVPRWFTLALTLPDADASWLRAFVAGLKTLSVQTSTALVGGDTTRGPLTLTVTAGGWVEAGRALRRSGARAGDVVCVTGTLGDAALALARLTVAKLDDVDIALRKRLNRPVPRVAAGRALVGLAHAAIDISDGLSVDLGHLIAASANPHGDSLGAVVQVECLPRSPAFAAVAPEASAALQLQLAGGDDYELCVCLASQDLATAQARCQATGTALTPIGQLTAEAGFWLESAGQRVAWEPHGYNHFA